MNDILPILGAVSLLGILPVLLRLRGAVRGTTLVAAWNWAIAGWLVWEAAWIFTLFPVPAAIQDQIWYAAAILGLCPPISVLGAKRPGSRVWAAFVVLPLVLVFAWPAMVGWVHGFPPERLLLETPLLLGYGLVLLMGYGNYLGTRQSLSSLLFAISLGWLGWQFADNPDPDQTRQPIIPTLIFVASVIIGRFTTTRTYDDSTNWDRLWREFQELYGIVWAKRIMDRVNFTARQEGWSARLGTQGLVWDANPTPPQTEHTMHRVDHTFRWLLRRFVDVQWIDERLAGGNLQSEN
jgi:hypothetical protein